MSPRLKNGARTGVLRHSDRSDLLARDVRAMRLTSRPLVFNCASPSKRWSLPSARGPSPAAAKEICSRRSLLLSSGVLLGGADWLKNMLVG